MVNWQQYKDEVILTIKKRIVNYFHHMLKDLYPSASSFSTSILVKVDMLDVIIYALLLILCYWSLLPHGLWGSIHGITGMTEVMQLAYPSHPNLEVMVRYYASSLQDYIQETSNARNRQEVKRQVVKFALLHPLDFYYYLRLVNNSLYLV